MRKLLLFTALGAALSPLPAAAEKGDFLIRARLIAVAPQDDASDVLPALPGASVEVDTAAVPELDFTYFFTDKIAAELILATSKHEISGTGGIAALGDIAETWVLPPTLTLQYHFMPEAKFSPYVGVGVNYTIFYQEDTRGTLNDAIGDTTLDLDESVGVSFQLGFDYKLEGNWFLNADVKYINIETEGTLRTGELVNTVDVDLNPIVAGIGFGYRF